MYYYRLKIRNDTQVFSMLDIHRAELESCLHGVEKDLTKELGKVHIRLALGGIGEAVKLLTKGGGFAVYWHWEWLDEGQTEAKLVYGFNLGLEKAPVIGRRIRGQFEKIPKMLAAEYPWLDVTKEFE